MLDPIERTCEVLFGVIVVLTFTRSITAGQHGQAETRAVLIAAIGCNLAWGIVDAAMYLISNFVERARHRALLQELRTTHDAGLARRLFGDTYSEGLSKVLTAETIEAIRRSLSQLPPPEPPRLTKDDFVGALAVFLLVFLSTFPVAIPFLLTRDLSSALLASNGIALAMLFVTGWSLGTHSGRPGWRTGAGTMLIGILLVAITTALGG